MAVPRRAFAQAGPTPDARIATYRRLDEASPEGMLADVRASLQQRRALGRDDFRAMVEARTRRFSGTRPAHRPRKLTLIE